jgi:UDP-glucose 4-epimerase
MKKILVAGSSGTIGTALCIELLKKGYDVTGVDKRRNKWDKGVDWHTFLLNLVKSIPKRAVAPKYDLIIHLAANAKVHQSVKTPKLALDNFIIAYNVLEFARETKTPIIFTSSREVYGDNLRRCETPEEEVHVRDSKSPYAATKLGVETLIHAYHHSYGLDYIIFRLSNVYGKYDESERVIPTWIKATRKGEDLIVYGEWKTYDFTYIDDCVGAFMMCIAQFEEVKNDTYNIAFGEGTRLHNLAVQIQQEMGVKSNLIIKDERVGEVNYYCADIVHARHNFGYNPKVGIEEGIKKTIKWYNENMG